MKEKKEIEKRTPRTQDLPTMENKKIEELDDAALAYVDIRDQRMTLTPKEVAAKERLIRLMEKNHLTEYHNVEQKILISITIAEKKVHVVVGEKAEKGE